MKNNLKESFPVGFVVGIIVAGAGFFLTKTDEGKEMKNKVLDEWDNIKKILEEEGVNLNTSSSLTDIILKLRTKIFTFLGEDVPKKNKKTTKKTVKKIAENKLKKSRKKMFKGI